MNPIRPTAAALLLASLVLSPSVLADGLETAAPKTDAQRAMLSFVQRWHDQYNSDNVDQFVLENYAKDANVWFTGASAHGHEQFLKVGRGVKTGAPGRYMRIDHVHFLGDERAIVEAVVLDRTRPDFYSPWIAILTIRDGKIVDDRTYLDPSRWPGIDKVKDVVTPGGLGSPQDK